MKALLMVRNLLDTCRQAIGRRFGASTAPGPAGAV